MYVKFKKMIFFFGQRFYQLPQFSFKRCCQLCEFNVKAAPCSVFSTFTLVIKTFPICALIFVITFSLCVCVCIYIHIDIHTYAFNEKFFIFCLNVGAEVSCQAVFVTWVFRIQVFAAFMNYNQFVAFATFLPHFPLMIKR